jgi:hypothetical protein
LKYSGPARQNLVDSASSKLKPLAKGVEEELRFGTLELGYYLDLRKGHPRACILLNPPKLLGF